MRPRGGVQRATKETRVPRAAAMMAVETADAMAAVVVSKVVVDWMAVAWAQAGMGEAAGPTEAAMVTAVAGPRVEATERAALPQQSQHASSNR